MKAPKFITPHSAFRIPRSESGFTLVEIAMVLVLLGVLVTFGMTLVGPLTKKLKYNATKEIIQADIDGIEGWSYDGKLLPTSGTWATVVRNPKDAWLAQLYYVYDNNLTSVSTGGICGRSSTAICLNVACTGTASDTYVAFAVLSAADDHTVQTTLNSITIAAPGAGTGPLATPSTSDDIVYYVTLNELRTKAGCKGAQLQILNQELPEGYNGASYSAIIEVDPAYAGAPPVASPKYTWTITGAPVWLTTSSPLTVTGDTLTLPVPPATGIAATPTTTITVQVTENTTPTNTAKKVFLLNIQ